MIRKESIAAICVMGVIFSILVTSALFYSDDSVKKQKATVVPSGFDYSPVRYENQTFVISEIRLDSIGWDANHWSIKTTNDTKIHKLKTWGEIYPGDIAVFQKVFYDKICNAGVELRLPDEFQSVHFDIDPSNFTMSDLPDYYTERYDVQINFKSCYSPAIKTYNVVYRDGYEIDREELSKEGFDIIG